MTIQTAIDRLDSMRPNHLPPQQKIAWLSELDGRVWRDLIMTHYPDNGAHHPRPPRPWFFLPLELRMRPPRPELPEKTFEGYTNETDYDTDLLVPEPYSNMYFYYLCAQTDLVNGELVKYTNDSTLYNAAWKDYSDWYTRNHMPIQQVPQFRM